MNTDQKLRIWSFSAFLILSLFLALAVPEIQKYRAIKLIHDRGGYVYSDHVFLQKYLSDDQIEWLSTSLGSEVLSVFDSVTEFHPKMQEPAPGSFCGTTSPVRDWISDADLETISYLNNLRSLPLQNSGITDEGLRHLSRLKETRNLYLANTNVTDQGIVYLQDLKNLKHLDLSWTQITDAGLEQISKLKNLESLTLYGCKLSNEKIERLESSIPNIRVIFWRMSFPDESYSGKPPISFAPISKP